jgi:thiopurine S-methyltransferase
MTRDWLSRWENGHTGWHQAGGNSALRKFWPQLGSGSRVLVPLCGKSSDLLWLAGQGYKVTGVELSEIAVRAFFDESGLSFKLEEAGGLKWFRCLEHSVTVVCGDYFKFSDAPFDALYDRAALVALPPHMRPGYIKHTKNLLKPGAPQLLITLEFDQSKANGPPFSVDSDEVRGYWPRIRRIADRNDIRNCPPKMCEAGISEFVEVVWVSELRLTHLNPPQQNRKAWN